MHQFLIDRRADRRGVIGRIGLGIPQKSGCRAIIAQHGIGQSVQFAGGDAGLNRFAHDLMGTGDDAPGFAHDGDFVRRFVVDSHGLM